MGEFKPNIIQNGDGDQYIAQTMNFGTAFSEIQDLLAELRSGKHDQAAADATAADLKAAKRALADGDAATAKSRLERAAKAAAPLSIAASILAIVGKVTGWA